MKKIILLFTLFFILCLFMPQTKAYSIRKFFYFSVLDKNGNKYSGIGISYSNGNAKQYLLNIQINSECQYEFDSHSFITFETQSADLPQIHDRITSFYYNDDGKRVKLQEEDQCYIISYDLQSDSDGKLAALSIEEITGNKIYYGDIYNNLITIGDGCPLNNLNVDDVIFIKTADYYKVLADDTVFLKYNHDDNEYIYINNCRIEKSYDYYKDRAFTFIEKNDELRKMAVKAYYGKTVPRYFEVYVDKNCQYYQGWDFSSQGQITFKQDLLDNEISVENIKYDSGVCDIDYSYDYEIYPPSLYQRQAKKIVIPKVINSYVGKSGKKIYTDRPDPKDIVGAMIKGQTDPATYIVDEDGKLRWIKTESVAKRLFGPEWDSYITWFNDSIIYTYDFGEPIEQ